MIKFSVNCSEVLKQSTVGLELGLTLNQDTTFVMALEDLVVPSEVIDSADTGACFLGIQPSDGAKDASAIYLG